MGKTLQQCYELLGLDTDASKDDVKKAYKKLALECHPDKNPDDPEATSKFQDLGYAYHKITSDEQEDEEEDLFDWKRFFFFMFREEMYSQVFQHRCPSNCSCNNADGDDHGFFEFLFKTGHEEYEEEDDPFTEEEMEQFMKFDSLEEQREFNKKIFCAPNRSSKPKKEAKMYKPKTKSSKQLKAEMWKREKEMSEIAEEIETKKRDEENRMKELKTNNKFKKENSQATSGIDLSHFDEEKRNITQSKPQTQEQPAKKKKKRRRDRHSKKEDDFGKENVKQQMKPTSAPIVTPKPSIQTPANPPGPSCKREPVKVKNTTRLPNFNDLPQQRGNIYQPVNKVHPVRHTAPIHPQSNIWQKRQETQYEMQRLQPSSEAEEMRQIEIAIQMSKTQAEIEERNRQITALEQQLIKKAAEQQITMDSTSNSNGPHPWNADIIDAINVSANTSMDKPNAQSLSAENVENLDDQGDDCLSLDKPEPAAVGLEGEQQEGMMQKKGPSSSGTIDSMDSILNEFSDDGSSCDSETEVGGEGCLRQSKPEEEPMQSINNPVITQRGSISSSRCIENRNNTDDHFHLSDSAVISYQVRHDDGSIMCPYGRNCCLGKKCIYTHPPAIQTRRAVPQSTAGDIAAKISDSSWSMPAEIEQGLSTLRVKDHSGADGTANNMTRETREKTPTLRHQGQYVPEQSRQSSVTENSLNSGHLSGSLNQNTSVPLDTERPTRYEEHLVPGNTMVDTNEEQAHPRDNIEEVFNNGRDTESDDSTYENTMSNFEKEFHKTPLDYNFVDLSSAEYSFQNDGENWDAELNGTQVPEGLTTYAVPQLHGNGVISGAPQGLSTIGATKMGIVNPIPSSPVNVYSTSGNMAENRPLQMQASGYPYGSMSMHRPQVSQNCVPQMKQPGVMQPGVYTSSIPQPNVRPAPTQTTLPTASGASFAGIPNPQQILGIPGIPQLFSPVVPPFNLPLGTAQNSNKPQVQNIGTNNCYPPSMGLPWQQVPEQHTGLSNNGGATFPIDQNISGMSSNPANSIPGLAPIPGMPTLPLLFPNVSGLMPMPGHTIGGTGVGTSLGTPGVQSTGITSFAGTSNIQNTGAAIPGGTLGGQNTWQTQATGQSNASQTQLPGTLPGLPMVGMSPFLTPLALQMYYQTMLQMQMTGTLGLNVPLGQANTHGLGNSANPAFHDTASKPASALDGSAEGSSATGPPTNQEHKLENLGDPLPSRDLRRPSSVPRAMACTEGRYL